MERSMYNLEYIEKTWAPYLEYAEENRADKGMPPLTAEHKLRMGNVMERDVMDVDTVEHIPFDMTIAMCDVDLKQGLITQEIYDEAISNVELIREEKVGLK